MEYKIKVSNWKRLPITMEMSYVAKCITEISESAINEGQKKFHFNDYDVSGLECTITIKL